MLRLTSENELVRSCLLSCIVIPTLAPCLLRNSQEKCFTLCTYDVITQMGDMSTDSPNQANGVMLFTKEPFPWPGVLASCGQQLVMFDAQDARFRSIKLRPKQAGCAVCGENPSVTQLVDYEAFCGAAATDKVGQNKQSGWNISYCGVIMSIFIGMCVHQLDFVIWYNTQLSASGRKKSLIIWFLVCFSAANLTSYPEIRGSQCR